MTNGLISQGVKRITCYFETFNPITMSANFNLLLIVPILLLICSCSDLSKKQSLYTGKAIIAGRIIKKGEGARTVRVASGSILGDIERTVVIDSLGNFRIEIELSNPQNVQLFFKRGIAILYLNPQDSVYLELNETNFSEERFPDFFISGSGISPTVTKEIYNYFRFKRQLKPFFSDAIGKSIDEYYTILTNEIIRQDSVLLNYCENNKVTAEFKTWAEKELIYRTANYLIDYSYINPNYVGNLYNNVVFPIDDNDAIVSGDYGLHLKHYALYTFLWKDSVNYALYETGFYNAAYTNALNNLDKSIENGLSKDIMSYKLLCELYSDSFEDFNLVLIDVHKYLENPILINALRQKKIDHEDQTYTDISYLDPVSKNEREITGDFWTTLKEKHSGKIIYIDIWTTWCGPCKMEIPYAIELQESFKDMDIAFVNLCMDSDKASWQKTIVESSIPGENYFFNKEQTQLFRDKLKFEGYPTYLIIDKKGMLIDNNASRPSSGDKIKQTLTNYLNKNTPQ